MNTSPHRVLTVTFNINVTNAEEFSNIIARMATFCNSPVVQFTGPSTAATTDYTRDPGHLNGRNAVGESGAGGSTTVVHNAQAHGLISADNLNGASAGPSTAACTENTQAPGHLNGRNPVDESGVGCSRAMDSNAKTWDTIGGDSPYEAVAGLGELSDSDSLPDFSKYLFPSRNSEREDDPPAPNLFLGDPSEFALPSDFAKLDPPRLQSDQQVPEKPSKSFDAVGEDDDIRCVLCFNNLPDAALSCRHVYCMECLQTLKKKSKPCPCCNLAFRSWRRVIF